MDIINWIYRTKTKTPKKAIQVLVHESLHEVTTDISNTVFTEALFDVLCGRKECGLWFGDQIFNRIFKFIYSI